MNTKKEAMKDLIIDETRRELPPTGIYIRARGEPEGKWESVDIVTLKKESLLEFLKAKPTSWPINVVGILLGHGNLTDK